MTKQIQRNIESIDSYVLDMKEWVQSYNANVIDNSILVTQITKCVRKTLVLQAETLEDGGILYLIQVPVSSNGSFKTEFMSYGLDKDTSEEISNMIYGVLDKELRTVITLTLEAIIEIARDGDLITAFNEISLNNFNERMLKTYKELKSLMDAVCPASLPIIEDKFGEMIEKIRTKTLSPKQFATMNGED